MHQDPNSYGTKMKWAMRRKEIEQHNKSSNTNQNWLEIETIIDVILIFAWKCRFLLKGWVGREKEGFASGDHCELGIYIERGGGKEYKKVLMC